MPELINIIRFGENYSREHKENKWYELETGEKKLCSEEAIDIFWWEWVGTIGSRRFNSDGYTVFEFSKPATFDLEAIRLKEIKSRKKLS